MSEEARFERKEAFDSARAESAEMGVSEVIVMDMGVPADRLPRGASVAYAWAGPNGSGRSSNEGRSARSDTSLSRRRTILASTTTSDLQLSPIY